MMLQLYSHKIMILIFRQESAVIKGFKTKKNSLRKPCSIDYDTLLIKMIHNKYSIRITFLYHFYIL